MLVYHISQITHKYFYNNIVKHRNATIEKKLIITNLIVKIKNKKIKK